MGSFKRAIRGIQSLVHAGFNPIITVADWSKYGKFTKEMAEGLSVIRTFFEYPQLRLKKLPLVLLGRCAEFVRPYDESERVTEKCFDNYPMDNLQCATSRIVTSKGVFVCPILIADPKAWMGWTLGRVPWSYTMESPACYTCRTSGLTCKNEELLTKLKKNITRNTVRESVNEFLCHCGHSTSKGIMLPNQL